MEKNAVADKVALLSVPAGIQHQDVLGMDNMAGYIRAQIMPDTHAAPIFDFFQGLSPQRVAMFQDAHSISDEQMKAYYDTHIKSRQPIDVIDDMYDYVEKFVGIPF